MVKRLNPIEHDNSFREGMEHQGIPKFVTDSCDISEDKISPTNTVIRTSLKLQHQKAFSDADKTEALDIYYIAGEYAGSDFLIHLIRILPMNRAIDGKILIDAKEYIHYLVLPRGKPCRFKE